MQTTRLVLVASVLLSLLGVAQILASTPAEPPDQADRSARGQPNPPKDDARGTAPRQIPTSVVLGPAPRLDPITRFLPPIDPWVQSGFGWGDVADDERGEPLCMTNHPAATDCDPAGPRPFLHAGFDALPAPDRTVRASAAGRVVSARNSFAPFVGGGPGESGGVVVIEHDMDGDPSTRGDLLQTVYEHVDSLVAIGDIVTQGQVIARTSIVRGRYLHFGVRLAPFDPSDPDIYRTTLPPPGATGCPPCFGRQLPVPAFPERWEDPLRLIRNPSGWAELLGSGEEGGADVVETPEGYLAGGWSRAANIGGTGADDMWLVRLDPEGHILSQRAYGGPGADEIRRLLPTADGGYLALARTRSFGPGGDAPMLVKFDATTEHIEWQTVYVASGHNWGNDVRSTSDGGYVLAGATDACACGRHRATVVKLDAGGAVQWAKSYKPFAGTLPSTDALSVTETPDGGYVGVGTVNPGVFGAIDLLVFRLDSTGQSIWSSIFGDTGVDVPGQIEATSDGDFVIVGTKGEEFGPTGLWFLKVRSDGSLESENTYATFVAETGTRMVPMPDGGFVVAGHIYSVGRRFPDLSLLRLDATGQIVKQRGFEGRDRYEDVTSLHLTRDGGLILTGGQDDSCSICYGGEVPPFNFVVLKTDADLEVSHGCGEETAVVPFSRASFVTHPSLAGENLAVSASPTNLTTTDTGARAYACDEGFYGSPPVFQSASVQLSGRSVACDFTSVIEGLLCPFEIQAQATMPIILSGSYDELHIEALVTDADSTPDRSDIVEVHAGLSQGGGMFPVPLLDDGSSVIVPQFQRADFGEICFEDPFQQGCFCQAATYPTSSGDLVAADSVYTRRDNLVNPTQSLFLDDCATSLDQRNTLIFSAQASLDVSLQATDRLGNVSVWPVPFKVTPEINTLQCSGDACGCCILLAFEQRVDIAQCTGLEGMPSPQYPCGLCIGVFGPGCGP